MSSTHPAILVDLEALLASLRSLLGAEAVQEDDVVAFAIDSRAPRAAVFPRTAEEVAATLAAAAEAAVIPWGSGKHMGLGNLPARYDLALSTARLDHVLEYEPADLTVTVEAGIPLATLQARLAETGQFLPLDPPGTGATVGGILAANASGPWRHAYGTARDLLLGCRVAHADGTLSRGGGRVVKNVAGYDMPKLYIGSLGTLGVIVEATFRVSPVAAAQETFLAAFPSAEQAAGAALRATRMGLRLRALELMDPTFSAALLEGLGVTPPDGAWGVAACTAGGAAAVCRTLRELEALCAEAATGARRLSGGAADSFWERLREAISADGGELTTRASVLPSQVPALMETLAGLAKDSSLGASSVAHLTAGAVHTFWRLPESETRIDAAEKALSEAEAAVRALGGWLAVEWAPSALKERIDVFWRPPEDFALMRAVKEQFDPRGTLSPGRFLGRL